MITMMTFFSGNKVILFHSTTAATLVISYTPGILLQHVTHITPWQLRKPSREVGLYYFLFTNEEIKVY